MRSRLPELAGVPPSRRVSEPWVADAFLALVVFGLSAVAYLASSEPDTELSTQAPDVWAWLLLVASCVLLVWRRRRPVAVLIATGALSLLTSIFYGSSALSVLVALYTVAAYCDRRVSLAALAWSGAALAIAIGPQIAREPDRLQGGTVAALVLSNVVVFLVAWGLGALMHHRRSQVATLVERTERLERQRELDAARAVDEERARIARELHDVVAHHVSVMVVQAQAAQRIVHRDPDRAEEAMEAVTATGRQAMDEMRRMLDLLRGAEHQDLEPQPSVEAIGALVEQVGDAGLEATLVVEGHPVPLPSVVGLSAYRIVQEALTNTLKHAGPARAHVRLHYSDTALTVEVTDDGRGTTRFDGIDAAAQGRGIVGMRERVALFGGSLRAGPRDGGGYAVHAVLPLPGAGVERVGTVPGNAAAG